MIEINDESYNYLSNLLYNTPRIVKEHITMNDVDFNVRDDFFKLKDFIDKILREDSDDRYFLIAGLRGVGKTTLLFQLYNYLHFEKNISCERLLYLDLGRVKDIPDFNLQKFLYYFIQDINGDNPVLKHPIFIFVDESQYSNNWSNCGKVIFDEQKKFS